MVQTVVEAGGVGGGVRFVHVVNAAAVQITTDFFRQRVRGR